MRTNMSFPTVSPGLIHHPRFSERMPAFVREAHQLKLTLKPIPGPTATGRGSANSAASQELSSVYLGRPPLARAENGGFFKNTPVSNFDPYIGHLKNSDN